MQSALDETVKLSIQAIADQPRLLIWPEATIDEGVFHDRPLNEAVESICDEVRRLFPARLAGLRYSSKRKHLQLGLFLLARRRQV